MNSEPTLVTNVMTILMPYVVKGAEEFAKLVGEAAYHKAKRLFETLKARFAGDPVASDSQSIEFTIKLTLSGGN